MKFSHYKLNERIKGVSHAFMIVLLLLSIDSAGQEIRMKSSVISPAITDQVIVSHDPNMNDFIHFELYLVDKSQEQKIKEAVHHFPRLENYRFVDARRQIVLSNDLGFVVLYSAHELEQRTGRRVRPQNIRNVNEAVDVEFVLTEQGTIKEIVLNK